MTYRTLADILAYDAPSRFAVAGFDLQRTGHSLPHFWETLPDVQNRYVHEGHFDCTIGPQLDVIHGTLVRLHIATAEQLCGSVDRHRSKTQSVLL